MNFDPAIYGADQAWVADRIAEAGYTDARITLDLRRPDGMQRAAEDALRYRHIRPLRVLARESFTPDEWQYAEYTDRIRAWQNVLGDEADYEAGNEPEAGGGPSSATQAPDQFAALIRSADLVRDASTQRLITGGLVRGDPYWLLNHAVVANAIRDTGAALGHHLYEASPDMDDAALTPFLERSLVAWLAGAEAVCSEFGRPMYITEIGYGTTWYSPAARARAYAQAIGLLAPSRWVAGIYPFSFEGVPIYALNPGGNPTPAWATLADTIAQYTGGEPVAESDPYIIDDDTRAEIARLGLVPIGDSIDSPAGEDRAVQVTYCRNEAGDLVTMVYSFGEARFYTSPKA